MATVSPGNPSSVPSGEGRWPASRSFGEELCALALDLAPRLFAVAQVYAPGTEDADGRVAAWGVAYEDGHARVTSVDGGMPMSLSSPERAVWWFARREGITARLVWLAPSGAASFHRETGG